MQEVEEAFTGRLIGAENGIKSFCTPWRREFTYLKTGTKYEAFADNVNANDGLIPDVLVIDEIHRMKDAQINVIDGATSNLPDALKIVISTAGSGDKANGHGSWKEYDYAKKVQTGEIIDTRFLPIIYECPNGHQLKGEAIYDIEKLVACNPVLQESPEARAEAEKELAEAKIKRKDNWWKRFRLNVWIPEDGQEYVSPLEYEKCEAAGPTEEALQGREVFGGFDKSGGVWDFHALTLLFPMEDGQVLGRRFPFPRRRPHCRNVEGRRPRLHPRHRRRRPYHHSARRNRGRMANEVH